MKAHDSPEGVIMSKSEKLKALDAEYAKKRAELELTESLRDHLPLAERESARIFAASTSYLWITFGDDYRPARTLQSAADALLSCGEPIKCQHRRSGTLSIQPAELFKDKDYDAATLEAETVVCLEIEATAGYGPRFALVSWFRIEGVLCKVKVPFAGKFDWTPTVRYEGEGKRRRRAGWLWRGLGDIGEDYRVVWWSPAESYRGGFYWADLHNFKAWLSHEVAT